MLKKLTFLYVFTLCTLAGLSAQTDSLSAEVAPPFSLPRMASHYLSIDWSEAQWDTLAGREVVLIYLIDRKGKAELDVVRNVEDPAILDSLRAATDRLPLFTPARTNGVPAEALYSIRFSFPDFPTSNYEELVRYKPYFEAISREELATDYELSHNGYYLDLNFSYVRHFGEPARYLRPGGGFDLLMGGHWPSGWGAAMAMGFEFNRRKQPFPGDAFPNRDDQTSSGIFLGGLVDRDLFRNLNNSLSVRGELAYAAFNAASRLESESELGWIQYRGIHTGAHLSYSLRLGRYTPNPGISETGVTSRYLALNFVSGFRYRYFGSQPGTGIHFFAGVGMRMGRDDFSRLPTPSVD